MDKQAFFDNIRTQLKKTRLPLAAAERPTPIDLAETPSTQALIEQFATELEAVNGYCHRVESEAEAMAQIEALFEQYEATQFISWDAEHLPFDGVIDNLIGKGYQRGDTSLPRDDAARTAQQQSLAEAQIGLTSVIGALAETGSIVVQAGAGRGRYASLLPPVHIALVKADQLHATMHHFIRQAPDVNHDSSNVVVVTGPSRTADIEGVLTLGVHGPKELHIILMT